MEAPRAPRQQLRCPTGRAQNTVLQTLQPSGLSPPGTAAFQDRTLLDTLDGESDVGRQPANVMVTKSGRVKVLGFERSGKGLARGRRRRIARGRGESQRLVETFVERRL